MSPGHFSSEPLIRQIRGGTAFGATSTCLSHGLWFWAMISLPSLLLYGSPWRFLGYFWYRPACVQLNAAIVEASCPTESPALGGELRADFDAELSSSHCPPGFFVI